MLAASVGPDGLRLDDVALPNIGKGELLIRMAACGICGTDLEKIHGYRLTPPVLGHEVSGTIARVGEGVRRYRVGDRVFVHHHVGCGRCHWCRRGEETLCPEFPRTNLDPCGFADYFRVPAINVRRGAVLKLPVGVSFDEATFIEPLGCCLRALDRAEARRRDSVAVVGTGSVGLLFVQLLVLLGARPIIAVDLSNLRLQAARRAGADVTANPHDGDTASAVQDATDGRGADLCIVAAPGAQPVDSGLSLLAPGGRLVIFGAPPENSTIQLDLSRAFIRQHAILASYSTTERETRHALRLLADRRLRVRQFITHRFALESARDAFAVATRPDQAIKVVVTHRTA